MHVAIIGAGPRGLVELQRLVEWQRQTKRFERLQVTVIDPYGVGGRVWQIDQPHALLMNTNPNNVTLFADHTDQITGPIVTGPDLYDWTQRDARDFIVEHAPAQSAALLAEIAEIRPNGFASRSLYGAYAAWFYTYVLKSLPDSVTVRLVQEEVRAVTPQDGQYVVATAGQTLLADKVVMSLGHTEDELSPEQHELARFAQECGLHYVTPTHPQEYDFTAIKAHATVILRGLGLNFFDAVTLLTQERGGRYFRGDDGLLQYQPSGREPQIVAGSRRGFPLRAKGVYTTAESDFVGQFVNMDWINSFTEPGSLSGKELLQRVQREMEYAYYQVLLPERYPDADAAALLANFAETGRSDHLIEVANVRPEDQFNFDEQLNPEKKYPHSDRRDVMLAYLTDDVRTAQRGTKEGPTAAALEVLRDIRNDIRAIVERRLLSGDDYYHYILSTFKRADGYLAVGPPDTRIEELRALVQAGVVTILGPEMAVSFDTQAGRFKTWSKTYPQTQYFADCLVEARLPAINAETTTNPLIRSLFDQQLAHPQAIDVEGDAKKTGAVAIDPVRSQLRPGTVASQGIFFWGVPTEGENWFTTTSPHPDLPDTVIKGADRITAQIFGTVE